MDDIEDQEQHDHGGTLPGIAAALARPAGAGLPHWGGPAPRRATPTIASVEIPPEQ